MPNHRSVTRITFLAENPRTYEAGSMDSIIGRNFPADVTVATLTFDTKNVFNVDPSESCVKDMMALVKAAITSQCYMKRAEVVTKVIIGYDELK